MRRGRAPARLARPFHAIPHAAGSDTTGPGRAIRLLALAAALSTTAVSAARGQGEPVVEAPTGYVNDHAGVMDEGSRAKLEAFLDQVEKKTGAQFAVLTVKSTAPLTASDYKVKVFEQWGIGKKGEDSGLLLLVAIDERDARFETGYGLEGTLPDGFQSRLFRREMAPRFRQGDYAGGITAGMIGCAARLAAEKGVTLEWNGEELRYDAGGDLPTPARLLILFVVMFAILAVISAAARSRRGGWWMMGPGAGGWYGGGGGFGGGGSFGGFGAGGGGHSFGGFGGGGSGGGGGGGRW